MSIVKNKALDYSLLENMLTHKAADITDVLSIYDQLEPVSLEFMQGQWAGYEIITGHHLDGMLVPSGWYGKLFHTPDAVYPLLFFTKDKAQLYAVNPKHLPLNIKVPTSQLLGTAMRWIKPLVETTQPSARMRMIAYRGKVTGTMAYDDKPIHDHFVKIDDNTMLGLMDKKGDKMPYAFVLERSNSPSYQIQTPSK